LDACVVARDASGQQMSYVYFEDAFGSQVAQQG
jgi:hypothetical protein